MVHAADSEAHRLLAGSRVTATTLRRDSAPEREVLDRIETAVESIGQRVETLEQRMEIAGERQEFMKSLLET